jgi:hypothetical protein
MYVWIHDRAANKPYAGGVHLKKLWMCRLVILYVTKVRCKLISRRTILKSGLIVDLNYTSTELIRSYQIDSPLGPFLAEIYANE